MRVVLVLVVYLVVTSGHNSIGSTVVAIVFRIIFENFEKKCFT